MNELSTIERGLTVPGFKATPVGLEVSGSLTEEDWLLAGEMLSTFQRASPWFIGDWYRVGGERRWGESYSDCEERFSIKRHTAEQYVWVASEFEFSNRLENLSFRHHMAVAAIAEPHRSELLQAAVDQGWTVKQLEEEVKRLKPPKKKREIPVCTPAQISRAQKEAQEIVHAFRDRLKKVGNNGMYTTQSLSKVTGGNHETLLFIRQCEIAPNVEVHRTYGRKGLCQYQFVYTETMTHKDRVRELAQRIVSRADADTQSKLDATEILRVTEV